MNTEWKELFDIDQPPEYLYYANDEDHRDYTAKYGLVSIKGNIHMMYQDIDDATYAAATNFDRPVVYTIHSGAMYRQGFVFYKSENGVWLTERVPVEYLTWRA